MRFSAEAWRRVVEHRGATTRTVADLLGEPGGELVDELTAAVLVEGAVLLERHRRTDPAFDIAAWLGVLARTAVREHQYAAGEGVSVG